MFNALYSMDAIDDARLVDLFAGSGALGLEALSRGAAHAVFVERDRVALRVLESNIDTLGFADRSTVVRADGVRWIADAGHHDVVLADPPYAFTAWPDLLRVASCDVLVIESGAEVEFDEPWRLQRRRTYGTTVVTILTRTGSPPEQPTERSAEPSAVGNSGGALQPGEGTSAQQSANQTLPRSTEKEPNE